MENIIEALAEIVIKFDSSKEYMAIFKACLKWRFYIPRRDWRRYNEGPSLKFLCDQDEEVS
jgi:hypothetical protein